jgi:hypothetical protein
MTSTVEVVGGKHRYVLDMGATRATGPAGSRSPTTGRTALLADMPLAVVAPISGTVGRLSGSRRVANHRSRRCAFPQGRTERCTSDNRAASVVARRRPRIVGPRHRWSPRLRLEVRFTSPEIGAVGQRHLVGHFESMAAIERDVRVFGRLEVSRDPLGVATGEDRGHHRRTDPVTLRHRIGAENPEVPVRNRIRVLVLDQIESPHDLRQSPRPEDPHEARAHAELCADRDPPMPGRRPQRGPLPSRVGVHLVARKVDAPRGAVRQLADAADAPRPEAST